MGQLFPDEKEEEQLPIELKTQAKKDRGERAL